MMLRYLMEGKTQSAQIASEPSSADAGSSAGLAAVRPPGWLSEPYRGIVVPALALPTEDDSTQVWSMDLIKLLDTSWFGSDGVKTVGDILPVIIDKVSKWEEYEILKHSMEIYGQTVPIRMFPPMEPFPGKLRDGMNRIALAEIMGWSSMKVTYGPLEKSMWEVWDNSEMGIAYHNAKAKRLGIR